MKKPLMVAYMVTAILMIFTQCSEDEVMAPNEQALQSQAEPERRDSNAGRKNTTGKYITAPAEGTINGVAFKAEYRITEFIHTNNTALYAVATLSGISGEGLPAEVADLAGQIIHIPVQLPEGAARASESGRISCDILNLDLGPLDLDLLGLQIHLNEVILTIVAEAGGGNLLGNLLCAVTGLLDGVAAIAAISELLNQIINIIGILPG